MPVIKMPAKIQVFFITSPFEYLASRGPRFQVLSLSPILKITAQSELRERGRRHSTRHQLLLADPHDPCLPASQSWPSPIAATQRAPSGHRRLHPYNRKSMG